MMVDFLLPENDRDKVVTTKKSLALIKVVYVMCHTKIKRKCLVRGHSLSYGQTYNTLINPPLNMP